MMTANLVGFVVGTDGVAFLASQLFRTWDGARFIFFAATCLFVGVQLMFEYRYVIVISSFRASRVSINQLRYFREEELRQGIQRRC
jgi:hypothetical protein